jgi:hypothetical protein
VDDEAVDRSGLVFVGFDLERDRVSRGRLDHDGRRYGRG